MKFFTHPKPQPPTLIYLAQVALLKLRSMQERDFVLEAYLEAAIKREGGK